MRISTRGLAYQARRRRRRWRTISLLAALALAAGTVWITAFHQAADINARVQCSPPDATAGAAAGRNPGATPTAGSDAGRQTLPYAALDTVDPAPAAAVGVRVLNAGSQQGLATVVGAQLQQLGFGLAAAPGDDPLYPHGDMRCEGQIRFGPRGEAAARTLSLVVPCTQLVRDDRPDATVDLALGTALTAVAPNPAALHILGQLATPAGGPSQAEAAPHLDSTQLAAAHTTRC